MTVGCIELLQGLQATLYGTTSTAVRDNLDLSVAMTRNIPRSALQARGKSTPPSTCTC